MVVSWIDVLKLTVPFISSIVLIWIKSGIERYITKKNMQHALSRLLSDEVSETDEIVETAKRIAVSYQKGKNRLVTIELPSLISNFASTLADVDSKNAYFYSNAVCWADIVMKGLERLSDLAKCRAAASDEEAKKVLNRVIAGQAYIVAGDYISFAKAAIELLKRIPEKNRYQDAQAISALEKGVESATSLRNAWKVFPESNETEET